MILRRSRTEVLAALLVLALPVLAGADVVPPEQMPGPLQGVRFDQKLGETLPLDARFTDETGRELALGELFDERPVVLAFVYYECPMLCSLVMNGLVRALAPLEIAVGRDFDVVAVSIDPGETPAMARAAEAAALRRYEREGSAGGWHFLTGTEAEIRRVADAAGFRYQLIEETGEYAHAGGILVVTPDGTLAQYYYGIEYPTRDLRLALVEASSGAIGNAVDQILLYCFRYDPQLGKYTPIVRRVLRLAGVAFLLVLGLFLFLMLRRDRVARRREQPSLGAA